MTIRLGPDPNLQQPALRALVDALRAIIRHSRFDNLTELGRNTAGHPDRRRISELATGTRFPELHELRAVLHACDGSAWPRVERLFHAAEAERSRLTAQPHPYLGDRAVVTEQDRLPVVGEFTDWARLGVHRPITRLSASDDRAADVDAGVLPAYVLRDADVSVLRPALASMAGEARPSEVLFVLVIGDSAAGKTRAAVEAMRAELSEWRLFIPHGPSSLEKSLDDHLDLRHTVVWLDEVQDFLAQVDDVAKVRRLLTLRRGPTVLLATIRTDARVALRHTAGGRLLDLYARWLTLVCPPSEPELIRARALHDPWIDWALDHIGSRYGLAEVLVAGPRLVRHLADSRDDHPLAVAIVRGAIDCYRAGYTTPVPEPLLNEACRLYLEPDVLRLVTSDPDAFAEALDWARRPVPGACALLTHSTSWGDLAFDYLLTDATQPGRPPIHPGIWTIVLRHVTPGTLITIGAAAAKAGQDWVVAHCLRCADALGLGLQLLYAIDGVDELRRRAGAGSRTPPITDTAAKYLAALLAERGDEAELVERVDSGDWSAAQQWTSLLVERADEPELTRRAQTGDLNAEWGLIDLAAKRGDVDALSRIVDSGGDLHARGQLLDLLYERGDVKALTRLADAGTGDRAAANSLCWLLATQGDEQALDRRAHNGDETARHRLHWLRIRRLDELDLRHGADAGDIEASIELVSRLTNRDDLAGLAILADNGDVIAAERLAELLTRQANEQELTRRADDSDSSAAKWLAHLLVKRGDEDGLRRRSDRNEWHATQQLTELRKARAEV